MDVNFYTNINTHDIEIKTISSLAQSRKEILWQSLEKLISFGLNFKNTHIICVKKSDDFVHFFGFFYNACVAIETEKRNDNSSYSKSCGPF